MRRRWQRSRWQCDDDAVAIAIAIARATTDTDVQVDANAGVDVHVDHIVNDSPTAVAFGTAHLLASGMSIETARDLLHAAADAGVARFDTAPLYGHGRAEALVAEVASRHRHIKVTTKVGLEPVGEPSAARRMATRLLNVLPSRTRAHVRAALRGHPTVDRNLASGRFGIEAVEASIERSLARLGHIDRLLLHEANPPDVTDDLLDVLQSYRQRGDVAAFGIATGNDITAAAMRRSHGTFAITHFSVDPLGPAPPDLTAWPTLRRVGHGGLGPDARSLTRLRHVVASDAGLQLRLANVAATLARPVDDALAALLLDHAARQVHESIVATRRPARIRAIVEAARGTLRMPADARPLLQALLRAAR